LLWRAKAVPYDDSILGGKVFPILVNFPVILTAFLASQIKLVMESGGALVFSSTNFSRSHAPAWESKFLLPPQTQFAVNGSRQGILFQT
jgi:hypothetical protein